MSWKHLIVAVSAVAALAVGVGAHAGGKDQMFALAELPAIVR